MAEIAILRRVREEQERQRRMRARRPSKTKTALLLGGVGIGGYCMYHGVNQFLNRNVTDSASKGLPFPEGAVTASGAMLVLGGLSLLTRMTPSSARH